ncbi:methionine synthase [Actinocorallia populi]|uniref:methionine synthase n=1 Tax=Actinocorallia populi TaxID=2079200 RepID=UPI000D08853E|nr:methionine synthase [Actinocorallia populi]
MGPVSFPWPEASATGVGSYPGTDAAETAGVVFGELSLPHLPELPARGPGADLVGRGAAFLVELPVHLQPSGWRFGDRPGIDLRRALDHLRRDLDLLEEQAPEGPVKLQVCGPWTLAASIELPGGERALRDAGAVRDIIESLAEGVREHVAEVRRRLPRAEILLQVDEPSLPAVLAGRVPTASGFRTLRSVAAPVVQEGLRKVLAATDAFPIVHCCARDVPFRVLLGAGARGLSVETSAIPVRGDEVIGEAIEDGVAFFFGVVPGVDAPLPEPARSVRSVRELWRRLGFAPGGMAGQVVVTPACGLAGASPGYVRQVLAHCAKAARTLAETPE